MKLTKIKGNVTEIEQNGKTILFSYSTPVAAHIDGTFYRTDKAWSRTTSKHINVWLAGAKAESKPQVWFDGITVD